MISFFFRPSVGGLETHMDDLCRYLSSSSHRTFVVTFQPLTNQKSDRILERRGNLTVYRIPGPLHNMFYRFQSRTMLRYVLLTPLLLVASLFVMSLHRREIDVVHCHDLNSAALCAFVSWMFGKRSVITVHYVQDFIDPSSTSAFNRFGRRILSHFDAVIAISGSVGDRLAPLLGDRERIVTMTNWIDLSMFSPADKAGGKRAAGFENSFVVLFVGRMVSTKGVELVVQAASMLADMKDVKFVLIGQGPLAPMVQRASATLGNIVYTGPQSIESLREYYRLADVLVVPSTYEEGFGRVIMEALACGTPVIGSKRGAIPEAMDESVGLLIEPTAEALAAAVVELHDRKSELDSLASGCRSYAERRFGEGNAIAVLKAYGWRK